MQVRPRELAIRETSYFLGPRARQLQRTSGCTRRGSVIYVWPTAAPAKHSDTEAQCGEAHASSDERWDGEACPGEKAQRSREHRLRGDAADSPETERAVGHSTRPTR